MNKNKLDEKNIFDETLYEELIKEEKELLNKLSKSNIKAENNNNFNQSTSDILAQHENNINDHWKKIENINKNLERTNNFLIVVVLLLLITFIWRWYEAYYRLNSIQTEFIQKSEELNSNIKIIQEKMLNLEQDNKNINNYLDKNISKEVELQLYRIKYNNKQG